MAERPPGAGMEPEPASQSRAPQPAGAFDSAGGSKSAGASQPARASGSAATSSGPGRILIAVYGVFALAATARAGVQIATRFSDAPLAYLLSAFAAVVYLIATVALAVGGRRAWRVALVCVTVELIGVVTVGSWSLFAPDAFPDETVWSGYGRGYGFVPLVLPIVGLLWLRRTRPR